MKFDKLGLIGPLLQATVDQGYDHPTPIQEQTFLHVAEGRDVLGCAQTGTGKTAAFSMPVLQQLVLSDERNGSNGKKHKQSRKGPARTIRGLILTPTRELAAQIGDSLSNYGRHTKLRHTVIFGGVNQYSQVQALRKGVDILVATPGRLFDLIQQRHVNLSDIEILVLDEADRMLDMGFIVDIRKVMKLIPTERQTLLFSATMPPAIQSLTEEFMRDPAVVKIKAESVAADTVDQSVYFVQHTSKPKLLQSLLRDPAMSRVLVFSRTKRGADRICKKLAKANVHAEAIHSDKSQNARTRALSNFKSKRTRLLVATDIAARGIDVDHISHVINYDLPDEAETYVHRIGRTGRAKNEGKAITFA
ncbi:MAG: DEAD/DEAH box helicase, partial [Phycisphaerales bacterium]|nr:DEAD/DEAH box helicase [Phycisphaerales bacterium]